MSHNLESGRLDIFEELTAGGLQQPRFGYVDLSTPVVPDFEMRRILKRDSALDKVYDQILGIESEHIPEEK